MFLASDLFFLCFLGLIFFVCASWFQCNINYHLMGRDMGAGSAVSESVVLVWHDLTERLYVVVVVHPISICWYRKMEDGEISNPLNTPRLKS